MLAGVALRSLDALEAAATLPQFRLLAVLADLAAEADAWRRRSRVLRTIIGKNSIRLNGPR